MMPLPACLPAPPSLPQNQFLNIVFTGAEAKGRRKQQNVVQACACACVCRFTCMHVGVNTQQNIAQACICAPFQRSWAAGHARAHPLRLVWQETPLAGGETVERASREGMQAKKTLRNASTQALAWLLLLCGKFCLEKALDGAYFEHALVLGLGALLLDRLHQLGNHWNAARLVLHARRPRGVPGEDEYVLVVQVNRASAGLADHIGLLARGGSLDGRHALLGGARRKRAARPRAAGSEGGRR